MTGAVSSQKEPLSGSGADPPRSLGWGIALKECVTVHFDRQTRTRIRLGGLDGWHSVCFSGREASDASRGFAAESPRDLAWLAASRRIRTRASRLSAPLPSDRIADRDCRNERPLGTMESPSGEQIRAAVRRLVEAAI